MVMQLACVSPHVDKQKKMVTQSNDFFSAYFLKK